MWYKWLDFNVSSMCAAFTPLLQAVCLWWLRTDVNTSHPVFKAAFDRKSKNAPPNPAIMCVLLYLHLHAAGQKSVFSVSQSVVSQSFCSFTSLMFMNRSMTFLPFWFQHLLYSNSQRIGCWHFSQITSACYIVRKSEQKRSETEHGKILWCSTLLV